MNVQMPDQDRLSGPFVLITDDGDALFFATILEILEDRDGILRGERYAGYDSRGTRFVIRRVTQTRAKLFGLLKTNASALSLDRIEDGNFADEAKSRIAVWLRNAAKECYGELDMTWPARAQRTYSAASLAGLSLDELLRLGLKWAEDEPED